MKKALYLLLALVCAPLCMPVVAEAAPQPSEVMQAFPNYTKAELRCLLTSTAKVLDTMADQAAAYEEGSNMAKVAIITSIKVNEVAYSMPTRTLSRDAQQYLAETAGIQRSFGVRLKQLLTMVEKGKLSESAAMTRLQEIGAQSQAEMDKVDARNPQMAAKFSTAAGNKFGQIVGQMCMKDVQAAMGEYQAKHPDATQDELTITGWRATAKLLRDLATRL